MKRSNFLKAMCVMALAVKIKLDVPTTIRQQPLRGYNATLTWYNESSMPIPILLAHDRKFMVGIDPAIPSGDTTTVAMMCGNRVNRILNYKTFIREFMNEHES